MGMLGLFHAAAGTPASAVYSDSPDTATTPMDQPVSGNVLATANIPTGTTAQVTGFSVAGSTQVYPAGSNVTLNDPVTGEPIGTLVLKSGGDYTFAPVPGYVGPTPAVNVYSRNSNGVTDVSSLTIDVLPSEAWLLCPCAHVAVCSCVSATRMLHANSNCMPAVCVCVCVHCSRAVVSAAGHRHHHGRRACHGQHA